MRSRLLTLLGTLTLAVTGLAVSAGPAAADPARCGGWSTPADIFSAGGFSFGNGTPIYRGPYNDCTILGRGYTSQGIDVHCYLNNSFGNLFFFVRDTSTGVNGWVARADVNWDGTPIAPCYS